MMSLNRYRLRHLKKNNHKGAIRASKLLDRPDRLIGIILIGNNFVNIAASSIATIIAIKLAPHNTEQAIALATFILTFVILIFAEVTPKTYAAKHPEKLAFFSSSVLVVLLKILSPLVFLVNVISNGLLRLVGINHNHINDDRLSQDELRTIVNEAGGLIPARHKNMLVSILDLENVTVNDIMIEKNEIQGLDLDDDISILLDQIRHSQHTRLPLYKQNINNILGVLHLRNASRFFTSGKDVTKEAILQEAREPYFIPENTQLHRQLFEFQKAKRRIGFVVDEYGDILGIATLEDILEEIVGDFTTDMSQNIKEIHPQDDDSFIIDGSASIRDINKTLKWTLPTNGPKTLSGLITEFLESIPDHNICLSIGDYLIEIIQIKDNVVKTARIFKRK